MEFLKKSMFTIYLTALLIILFELPINAYIDPGTGSLVIQFIVGGIVGLSVLIKIFWSKIVRIFNRKVEK